VAIVLILATLWGCSNDDTKGKRRKKHGKANISTPAEVRRAVA
jgi:hypothetical protein